MVQLTRIYTKGGDAGETSLGSGTRVYKSHARIAAIGDVDETNSFIGWAREWCDGERNKLLERIQNDLFDLGADLCMPDVSQPGLRIIESQVQYLEHQIDEINKKLSPLKSFILPGGSKVSAALHMARSVARRAERSIVVLLQQEIINLETLKYVNRLSDLLFVMARDVNDQGKTDVLWVPGQSRDQSKGGEE